MARPPKNEETKRSAHLPRVRCTASERASIEAKAAAAGLSAGEFLRRACLDGEVIARQALADIQLIQSLDRLAIAINATGNNLNQLVRRAHIHGDCDTALLYQYKAENDAALARLDDLLELLTA